MADRYTVKKNSAGGLGFVVVDTTTNKDVAWVFDQARNPDLDESRAKLFADALNNGDKLADVRETLKKCDAKDQKIEELMRENKELHKQLCKKIVDQTYISSMAVRNGGLDMTVEGGLLKILADNFAGIIMESGAENYLEVSFSSEKFLSDELLVLTLQRCKGKTPHQIRVDLEQKLATIMQALKKCDAKDKNYTVSLFDFYRTVAQILGEK